MDSETQPRRVVVILGHPRGAESLNGALAEAYADGARQAGWTVDFFDLSLLRFEPNVVEPSPRAQALEPDLQPMKAAIEAAEHLVFVYPTWWGAQPAVMKGFLDRVLAPGWAFRDIEGGMGFEGLLAGRTAEILTTMDTPAFVYRWIYGAPGHNAMAKATLGFCGIETTRITRFGAVRDSDEAARQRWIADAHALGLRLETGPRGAWGKVSARIAPWLQALRLQFYPMTFIAYWVGALAASSATGVFDAAAFWLGYLILFLLEAATVFTNDFFDRESDALNQYWSPFTGGSRVLVDGALSPRGLMRGAQAVFALALLVAFLFLTATPRPEAAATLLALGALLSLGYTIPPLKLSHRGLGEIDVALTHSLGVLLFGYVAQGGSPADPAPWLLSLPMLLAVFPAITLSGVPDHDADKMAGKRTLVVTLGVDGAFLLAGAGVAAAAFAAIALRHLAGVTQLAGLDAIAPLHAALLIWLIARESRRGAHARRIDGLMAASLLYILWFGLVPLINLLA